MKPIVTVSLAVRFIVFISLLVLTTSLTLSLFFIYYHESERDEEIRRHGISLARNLAHNAELGVLTRNEELLLELARGLLQESDVTGVAVVDAEGSPLLEQGRNEAVEPGLFPFPATDTPSAPAGEAGIVAFAPRQGVRPFAYECSYPVVTRRGNRHNEEIGFLLEEDTEEGQIEKIGLVRVRVSTAETRKSVAGLKRAFLMLTGAVILLAVLLTILMVRRMVGPLKDLAAATRRIASGSLDEVVRESGQDELGQLASSFNRMTTELRRSRFDLEHYSASLEDQVRARTRELEEAQGQLVRAEKMSAVGLLVSGVAHELNNPLAGVVGYAQLLLKSDTDDRVRRGLEKINREAERCKKIVQNLQTFARKHKPQKDSVEINSILESTLELRSYQLKVDNITVVPDLDASLPRTMADAHQLQQVFLNIIINAHHSMALRSDRPGVLILRTRVECGSIIIEMQDNGPGIAPDNLGRIFDPFFTTKEVGQGTGLGLSICYGIIQEHKGTISAYNAPEGGAIFRLEIPLLDPEASEPGLELPTIEAVTRPVSRRNILVVDDELAIIDILYQVLRMDGHRVDTALNGTVALRKIEKESYDLIISDIKMPGIGGKELYRRVRDLNLDLSRRIIFSTGDVVNADTREFLDSTGNAFLQKPFEIDTIRRVVMNVLNTTAG